MTARSQLEAACSKLDALTDELQVTRHREEALASSINVPELARVKLAGGALLLQAGSLAQLQAARLEVEVLVQAIAIQKQRVEECESFLAHAEIAGLRREQENLDRQIGEQLHQLAQLFHRRDEVEQRSLQVGAGQPGTLRLPDPLQRLAAELIDGWQHGSPRRSAA